MKTFVTADLHFGHANILKHQANREFANVNSMNIHMIGKWNESVGPKDEVYVIGDFSFRINSDEIAYILALLNGTIHLVRGNHDYDFWKAIDILKANKHQRKTSKDPNEVILHKDRIVDLKHNGNKYVMCHYPMETWDGAARDIRGYKTQGKGAFHLHGHQHGKGKVSTNRLDVGYDATGNVVTLLDDIPDMIAEHNGLIKSGTFDPFSHPELKE